MLFVYVYFECVWCIVNVEGNFMFDDVFWFVLVGCMMFDEVDVMFDGLCVVLFDWLCGVIDVLLLS